VKEKKPKYTTHRPKRCTRHKQPWPQGIKTNQELNEVTQLGQVVCPLNV